MTRNNFIRRPKVNECEKRGLSIIEDSQLKQEGVAEYLWHKVQKAEHVFAADLRNGEQENLEVEIAEDDLDTTDLVDISLPFSCVKAREKRHRHIVGLSATRLDDSRKKWQINQIVMGCDGLLTS